MKKTLTMTFVLAVSIVNAMIIPASTLEKYNGSNTVIEGEIMSSRTVFDEKQNMIVTDFSVQIGQLIKGKVEQDEITIRVMGGQLEDEILVVTPNDEFDIGEVGVFFLNAEQEVYSSSFLAQSFVAQAKRWTKEQVQAVKEQPKLMDEVLAENRAAAAGSIQITSISPTVISAGNGEILTITGSGFGTTGPSGAIRVWYPLNNGSGYHAGYLNPNYYTSWSDTEIKMRVPEKAGTGNILLGSTTTNTTGPRLTVKYSVRERDVASGGSFHPRTVFFPSDGISDGILFHISSTFDYDISDHITALFTLSAALQEWNCKTQLNQVVHVYPQTQNTRNSSDGRNVLFLDNTLSGSVLGVTFTTIQICGGVPSVIDTDIGFNANINWNYTRNTSYPGQFDLYHTALHEFGHMRNLGHALNPGNIMFPSASSGPQNTSLDAYNIEGGLWIQNESRTRSVCSFDNMTDGVCGGYTDVEDFFFDAKIKMYPNPANSVLNIEAKNMRKVLIYNLLGELMIETNEKSVDISSMQKGLYQVAIYGEKYQAVRKLLID